MRKNHYLICIFLAVFLFLTTLRILGIGEDFADLAQGKDESVRYHPNGTEPVYVGVFGK